MKIDKSRLTAALTKFNSTYGCQFDIEKYEDALEETINDETPEKINQVYKDMFAEIYRQALQSESEGKVSFSSASSMFTEFENSIVFPLIMMREQGGYKTMAQPYGGMTRIQKDEFVQQLEVEKFNAKYGCQLDIKTYVEQIIEYSKKDQKPDNINKLYKDTFAEIYKQAIKKAPESLSGTAMMNEFENNIVFPILRSKLATRRGLISPFGGMSSVQRNQFFQQFEAERFNAKYGCKLNIEEYKEALKNYINDETPDNINQLFKNTFADIYRQYAESVSKENIKPASITDMLDEFDKKVIFPALKEIIPQNNNNLISNYGGMTLEEQNSFLQQFKNEGLEINIERPSVNPNQLDLSTLTPAINKFNTEYGCRFDIKKYTNALEKYSNDTTPERINNVYKEIFIDLHTQALKSVSSEKINRFSANDMLFDFESDIISPLLELRENAGIKDIAESNGGISFDERKKLIKNLDAELAKIKVKINRPAKQYNINDFREAVTKFNETYGCQFDIKKYEAALKQFANDETPDRINQTYRDMFAEVYKQTLRGVLDGKVKLESSREMLDEFQSKIIGPFLIASGYDNFAYPFGGMSELEQFQLMDKCIGEVPSNLVNQISEQYETGKLTLNDMDNFASEIFEDYRAVDDTTKKKFMACILALEKSYYRREDQNSAIAEEELMHINTFIQTFLHYYEETQYREYHFKTPQLFPALDTVKREIGQVLIKYDHSDPQWRNTKTNNRKNEEEKLPTPTENIMERYAEGRYPLRDMRRFANAVIKNPTLAKEEDRTRFVACISAIERIHSTRTRTWMIGNFRRYYAEYRDARDLKAAFIKTFGEKQYEMSKACADTGCSEDDYIDWKNDFKDADESFYDEIEDDFKDEIEDDELEDNIEISKERIIFDLEEIDGKVNDVLSEPINEVEPLAKNGPNINN